MRLFPLSAAAIGGFALRRFASRRAFDLRDKVVLITGGSRGLGFILARRFGRAGAHVVLCARNADELGRAREDLAGEGIDVHTAVCDVANREEVVALVEDAVLRFGRLDVVVNNASIIQVGPAEVVSEEDLRAGMDVNFWGTVHTTFAALPHMRGRGEGRILNITSIGAAVAVPHLLPYTCGKFAALGFSRGLRAELAKDGIRVTTVLPGLMRTGSFVHALVKGRRERETQWFALGASLPIISMNAERAAARIVRACVNGEANVTVGLPAKVLRLASVLLPSFTDDALGLVNRVLPGPGAEPAAARPSEGRRHRAGVASSVFTTLGDRAASEYNELYPSAPGRLH